MAVDTWPMIHMDVARNGAAVCLCVCAVYIYVCLCKSQTGFCKHSDLLTWGENSCRFDFAFRQVCVKGMSNANKFSWLTLFLSLSIFCPSCIFNRLSLLLPPPSCCLSSSASLPLSPPDAAQLYQQYSEAAQNFEILRQARSDVLSVCEDTTPSPAPSPPPARRPLPPLPPVRHPHSLCHTGSLTSVKSLPLPEPPKRDDRSSSPRLSISLTQSSTLWRELPGVRNSAELEGLTEDESRLQEVTQVTIQCKTPPPLLCDSPEFQWGRNGQCLNKCQKILHSGWVSFYLRSQSNQNHAFAHLWKAAGTTFPPQWNSGESSRQLDAW